MTHSAVPILIALLLLSPLSGAAQTHTCKKNAGAVTIDGVLKESSWGCADSFLLVNCIDGSAPKQRTVCRMFWDSANLYLGVVAHDRDIWATYTSRDAALWKEEVVEFFLDPDGDGKNYFEFKFNCRGAMMDMLMYAPWGTTGGGGTSTWTATGMEWAVKVHGTTGIANDTDTSMVVEVSLPWAALADKAGIALPPKIGATLKFNVYRIDGRYTGHSETKEYSCFRAVGSPPGSKFHSPDKFASLFIAGTPLCPTVGTTDQRRGRAPALSTPVQLVCRIRDDRVLLRSGELDFRLDGRIDDGKAVSRGSGN